MESHHRAVCAALRVNNTGVVHLCSVDMKGSRYALSFDGDIFSPVPATEKRFIRCVDCDCRFMERSYVYAKATRSPPVFNSTSKCPSFPGAATSSDDAGATRPGIDYESPPASADPGHTDDEDDDAAILSCTRTLAKRNLLPCLEERKLAEKWLRTAYILKVGACSASSITPHG